MSFLNDEHVKYIYQDLQYRGIVKEGLMEEFVDHLCEMVEGKMATGTKFYEAYHESLQAFGHTKGLRKTQLQDITDDNKINYTMIRNYLKIAFRNIQKNRLYSTINIAGLAVGITCCLLISLFIWDELNYDKHHRDSERIYRITNEVKFNGNHFNLALAPAPLADALNTEFPDVEAAVRFRQKGSYIIQNGEKKYKEHQVIFADSTLFDVFTIPLITGNAETALDGPDKLIISEKLAEKYFSGKDARNQTLILDNTNYVVSGVFKDMPTNSHFHFDIIISMAGLAEANNNMWVSNNFVTYLKLKEGVDPEVFNQKIEEGIVKKYISPQLLEFLGHDLEQFRAAGNILSFKLQPLERIHLYSDLTGELGHNGSITYVYLFATIALFILLIACINFMNLSTARSASRAKEVGIRKVLGSFRSYLIRQFLAESTLLTAIAFILALGIAQVLMPFYNDLADKSLSLPLASLAFWGLILFGILFIGFLSGTYPAFFLSSFKPARVLKSNKSKSGSSSFIRSTLVIFQFSISILLIIGTIVVHKQLQYIQQKNIGFNRDQVILIHDAYGLGNNLEAFKNEVLDLSTVQSGTVSWYLPAGANNFSSFSFWAEGVEPTEATMVSMQLWDIDHNYIPTLQMELVDGRNFSPDFLSDSSGIILNESAARAFGLMGDPIGQNIETFDYNPQNGQVNRDKFVEYKVVGVVKDFHFQSLKEKITPLGFKLNKSSGYMAFRFHASNTSSVIGAIEKKWNELSDGQPFLYSFMEDDFEQIYTAEMRLGEIFTLFAALAIFIACLGLFALSSFTAEQRIKEIGIRKVMGASVSNIVLLFTKDFSRLVVIAFVIAIPMAVFVIQRWLENYSYKTEVALWVYIAAGMITLIIALLTMSFQSIKAAMSNPVDSLKHD